MTRFLIPSSVILSDRHCNNQVTLNVLLGPPDFARLHIGSPEHNLEVGEGAALRLDHRVGRPRDRHETQLVEPHDDGEEVVDLVNHVVELDADL